MLIKCEKCGGSVTVAALRTPQEVHLVGSVAVGVSSVEARVCLECGHTVLYATNPGVLRPRQDGNPKVQYELGEFRNNSPHPGEG